MIETSAINILALIFIVFALLKLFVFSMCPKKSFKKLKDLYENQNAIRLIILILVLLVFNYLRKELYIKEILATALFLCLLFALSLVSYSKDLITLIEKKMKKRKIIKQHWISILIWLILILLGIKEIFF